MPETEIEKLRLDGALLDEPMPLQFDIETTGKQACQHGKATLCDLTAPDGKTAIERAIGTAG